ncbi:uncharacterized protein LOC111784279 [Cucurbita pepo subsp. pepo]|uniref:uncharacterized protein LOC111784279 n=1 Tax=Cucurbita pepo subsp. pepo TaxID=3664 RepID=UPI000C9DA223|nr:uncharacterized protein LOC111784279 [Cucurbita pepo subsp. pepo]
MNKRKEVADPKFKDLRANNYLFQTIDCSIQETILDKERKGIWDSMKKKFQGNTKVKRAQLQALCKNFKILHMKEGETFSDFFSRNLTIANKMCFHGEKMGDVSIIEKILHSVTSKFDYVACFIEESNDLDIMTIDKLQSSLLVNEQRMKRHTVEEQTLKIALDSRTRRTNRGVAHFEVEDEDVGDQVLTKTLVECFYCHDLDHFQYECPKKNKGKESQAHFA